MSWRWAICVLWAGAASGFQTPPATGSIEGQILHGGTGAPLKKAAVRITSADRGQTNGPAVRQSHETNEQGRFSFTGLPAGRYMVSAERTGFLAAAYGAHKYSGGGTRIQVGTDGHVKGIDIKLMPQAVLVGKVLDEDGEPAPNIEVRALKLAYRGGKKQWVNANNAETSDIGEFRIPNLEPGKYLVTTNPRNMGGGNFIPQGVPDEPLPQTPEMRYAATYYPSTTNEANASPVEVGAGGEVRGVDIRLVKTQVVRIRGKVNGLTGGGRGGAAVILMPKDGSRQAQARAQARPPDNRFEIRGVTPGSYILYTQANGGRDGQSLGWRAIEVGSNPIDGVVLDISAGNDVQGSVKIEDANPPVSAANVSVFLRSTLPIAGQARGKAGDDSKFVLKNVAALHYTVSVTGLPENCYVKSIRYGGQEVTDDGVDITSAGAMDITLSATAGQIAAGVVDKEGKPLSNATVLLMPKDGPVSSWQVNMTDDNGALSFKRLKPGDYRVIAWEDIPSGATQDPDFVKKYEGSAQTVKVDASGNAAVQVKAVPVE